MILRESEDSGPPNLTGGAGQINARKISLLNLARILSTRLDRPVMDRTGLTGTYEFDLTWTPDQMPQRPPGSPDPPPADPNGPSIFTAVQEQLGLKLESTKGTVDVLVIDRAEHPTPN